MYQLLVTLLLVSFFGAVGYYLSQDTNAEVFQTTPVVTQSEVSD